MASIEVFIYWKGNEGVRQKDVGDGVPRAREQNQRLPNYSGMVVVRERFLAPTPPFTPKASLYQSLYPKTHTLNHLEGGIVNAI